MSQNAFSHQMILDFLHADASTFAHLRHQACSLREKHFGKAVFFYGFLYAGTFCRNDCVFCQYRRSHKELVRQRIPLEQILEAAQGLARDGVHLLDLTLGEDPYYIGEEGFPQLLSIVSALREATGLPVMISPGVLSAPQLEQLHQAGADWYACYQETHARELFDRLRVGQSFDVRHQARLDAAACGMHVEDGMLVCVGESDDDVAYSLLRMAEEPLRQVRAMGYVPHAVTLQLPERWTPEQRLERECRIITLMRLLMPELLIPATLDVDGLAGLKARLEAGANVVTSIVPSDSSFRGVASDTDIDSQKRSVSGVLETIQAMGLEAGTVESYRHWLEHGSLS